MAVILKLERPHTPAAVAETALPPDAVCRNLDFLLLYIIIYVETLDFGLST